MNVELNRMSRYLGRSLLCVAHSDRPLQEPANEINYIESRYASPARLPPAFPFESLRPAREHDPHLGGVTIYDIGEGGERAPELVCAFRPKTYKPQHCLWLNDRLWVLGTEHIEIYDPCLKSLRQIRDPWLSGGHTMAADGAGGVLVSCSASDSVLRFDEATGALTGVLRLPEELYGFNYPLARHDSVVDHFIDNDLQLAHVNCAWPWRGGILTTSLIQGAVGWFDPQGDYQELVRGFVGCHGARIRDDADELFFSDSCSGMVVFLGAGGAPARRVGTGSRWLHDAIQIRGNLFAMALFDQNQVLLMNVATREVVGRIRCDGRGGPQFLAFGSPGAAPAGAIEHRRETIASANATRDRSLSVTESVTLELQRKCLEQVQAREATIAALREERTRAVESCDAIIAEAHAERAQAVAARDGLLAECRAERDQAVSARDAMLADLEARRACDVSARDAMLADLEARRACDVRARDLTIARLHEQLTQMALGRDAMLADLDATRSRDVTLRDVTIDECHREIECLTRGWRRWIIGRRR
jgi:hypothetical protein